MHQQIRGSGSPASRSITRRPPKAGIDEHHPRRLRSDLADLRRLLAAGHRAQRRQRRARPTAARRTRRSSPSLATYIGSIPSSSQAPPPPARPVRRSRGRALPPRGPRELVERRGDACRAWRRACSAGPRLRRPAARPPPATATRVSETISRLERELARARASPPSRARRSAPRRGSGRLARARPATSAARGSSSADAGRAHVHAVGVAALDDLRVARDHPHPRARAAAATASISAA